MVTRVSYRDAGVDIDEADRAVSAIRGMARGTFTKGVLTDIGSFGGCFALPKMRQPVLVSSVDGVGTKLKIAFATGRHDTIGEDLVNHCVNDIAVQLTRRASNPFFERRKGVQARNLARVGSLVPGKPSCAPTRRRGPVAVGSSQPRSRAEGM